MKKILILTAVKPDINETIWSRHQLAVEKLLSYKDSRFKVDYGENKEEMFDLPNDIPRVSKVVRIRNKMIEDFAFRKYDYIFWLDADLVEFAPDTLSHLFDVVFYNIAGREGGTFRENDDPDRIVAALPLIEETEKFYDTGAFIQRGTSHIQPHDFRQIWGRNVNDFPPYFHPGYEEKPLVEMDSVAQCVLIPSFLYNTRFHSAENAFYEFWPICDEGRKHGVKTFVDTRVKVFHANFVLYTQPGKDWRQV